MAAPLHQTFAVPPGPADLEGSIGVCSDPNVLPYKENLERLLDDKHFKDEIVHFNISEEQAVVDASHRAQLVPLLMRVLFGPMCSKTGSRFQGQSGAVQRSSIVLRFLAGCQSEELSMFIDLLLEPVCHHRNDRNLSVSNSLNDPSFCCQSITILIKNMKTHTITVTQLQVLLGYVEEDIYDQSRQATTFGLLKAILSRKLVVPSLVGADEESGQAVCCRAERHDQGPVQTYLPEVYPGLSYGEETEITSGLHRDPAPHSGLFFVPLALAMVNDDSARCKKMAAVAIKSLLSQLDQEHQNTRTLFSPWSTLGCLETSANKGEKST
ncbi:small subunit processome component 20 homolog isoform X3 [Oncorhynchus masou masou]|uniref:small subunit processome component 20 homolog isoform X3 n=1 Tax=Oncorhynchus masou masou TaxID=90313 RepID=UPI003182FFE7